jgi:hypothetical protein
MLTSSESKSCGKSQHPAASLNALRRRMDCRVIGERSGAVLRTAMPGNDDEDAHVTISVTAAKSRILFAVT